MSEDVETVLFWVVTPYSFAGGYQCFRKMLPLYSEPKIILKTFLKMVASTYVIRVS